MPKKQFEVIGLDEAARDMEKWAKEVGPEVEKGTRDLAGQIADRVSNRVPVLTGTLSSSVEVVDISGEEVAIGDGVEYAGWIEFGGSRGRALVPEGRYLYPTALEFEEEFGAAASDIAEQSAERFSWSTPAH
jgi:hypothetical protein